MPLNSYTFPLRKAEFANGITHAVGIVCGICFFGKILLLPGISPINRLGMFVFAFCMLEMYSISTIYHLVKSVELKHRLRLFDHISIYFLIAGTYTPLLLGCLDAPLKYILLSIIWTIVGFGILYKMVWWRKFPKLSLYFYLAMGWMVVFFIKPVFNTLPTDGFIWLISGGLLYSIGTLFYANKKPLYNHAIWHIFVLLGTVCHFLSILSLYS